MSNDKSKKKVISPAGHAPPAETGCSAAQTTFARVVGAALAAGWIARNQPSEEGTRDELRGTERTHPAGIPQEFSDTQTRPPVARMSQPGG
jgi:hypothetical protein